MAGSVFSKIAERVYAKNLRFDIRSAIDSTTNVIPAVKFNSKLTHLIRRKGSPHHIIGTAVHTIFAIIDTLVGKQNLEKGDASAVR